MGKEPAILEQEVREIIRKAQRIGLQKLMEQQPKALKLVGMPESTDYVIFFRKFEVKDLSCICSIVEEKGK